MTSFLSRIDPWNWLLTILLLATFAFGIFGQPNFTSTFNLSQLAASAAEKALLVLPMVLLIIAREIDLSVASVLALTSVVFGILVRADMNIGLAMSVTLFFGAVLGWFNGWLVAKLDLPSLLVTLGTMAMYRGIGYIFLGNASVNVFPDTFIAFGNDNIPGTHIPWVITPFLVFAPIFIVALQFMPVGKRIYAAGGNPDAARYSGILVERLRLWLFVVSGVVCAIAGIVYTARLSNARANNGLGMELDVITMVLLGGVSVFGGKGKITGVILALVLIATLRNILGLNQIGGDAQGTLIGLLLIVTLLISNSTGFLVNRFRVAGQLNKARG
jgi:rhamnose transport system permease protein